MTPPVHAARAASFPAEADTLSGMFEQQAAFTPDLPAIVASNEALSFGELDLLSRRIAGALHRLPAAGPVVLLMRESPLLFAVMLGAARAGRIFIPLEITGAASWMARVVASSGAAFVIADEKGRDLAQRIAGDQALFLDADALAESDAPPLSGHHAQPDDVASILYTSGSTGHPKGVAMDHAFILRGVRVRGARYGYRPGDRFGHLRSSGYSGGFHNSFAALLNGAGVYAFDVRTQGMHRLAAWLNSNAITQIAITGSLFRTWLARLPETYRFPHLRVLQASAEPVYGSDLQRLGRHLSGNWRLLHGLSSTEMGVITHAEFGPASPPIEGALPVGWPLPDVDIRLEDQNGHAVAPGEEGEIVIRSRTLARGYWKDDEATAARFSQEKDGRCVYRTRDMGRFLADGTLEYLGRRDRKIKLRGYSVEPYEVECALLRLPNVRDAAVVIDGEGDAATLFAFISGPRDCTPEAAKSLRDRLASDLPPHLVPARVTVMPSLPLTPRGKIDRNLLLKCLPRKSDTPVRPPSDDIERTLFEIWRRTLRRSDFGIDDNFHELGASSLQVFYVFSWLDALGWNLPPSMIFEAPTIAQQAEILHLHPPFQGAAGRIIPFRETGSLAPVFFIHARKGDILYARELYPLLKENRPLYGIRAPILDGSEPILRSVEEIAATYLADARRVQPKGPYNICGYSFGGIVAFEMARLLRAAGEEVALLGMIDTQMQAKGRYAPSGARAPRGLKKVGAYLWSLGVAVSYWQDEIRMLLKMPVPHERRLAYYTYTYMQASRRYQWQLYDGSAVMFSSAGRAERHSKSWSPFFKGGFEVLEIPGDHSDIIWPPLNGVLAEAINAKLDAIESRLSAASPAAPGI